MALVCEGTGPVQVVIDGTSYQVLNTSRPPVPVQFCYSWVDATVDLQSVGITPEDAGLILATAAGGVIGIWILGMIVGSVSRLFHTAITGD